MASTTVQMSIPDFVCLAASILSVVVSIVAVWLAITFYRMSMGASERMDRSSADIKGSVQRLNDLFDKMYAGTFSALLNTYDDMRKHVWSPGKPLDAEEAENRENREVGRQVEQKVAELTADGMVPEEILPHIESLVSEAVARHSNEEKARRFERIRGQITSFLEKREPQEATLAQVFDHMRRHCRVVDVDVVSVVFEMLKGKVVTSRDYDDKESISEESAIALCRAPETSQDESSQD